MNGMAAMPTAIAAFNRVVGRAALTAGMSYSDDIRLVKASERGPMGKHTEPISLP